MRIALAQTNPTVGDVAGNTRAITERIEEARRQKAELVIFPELAVIGYPPKDLLLKPDALDQCERAVGFIAEHCRDIAAIVGYPCVSDDAQRGRPLYNAAAVCQDGRMIARHVKSLLPTYDVFDETRYFEPGPTTDLTQINGTKLGISICEDLWNDKRLFARQLYHDNPIEKLAAAGARLFINCAASPFVMGKHAFRLKLSASAAERHRIPLVYVNQVGGNDELIFDGRSCVIGSDGQLIAHARGFEEDLLVVDVPIEGEAVTDAATTRRRIEPPTEGIESIYHALVLGLRDYCRKCGFTSIVVGLSGGIDSAVTAALAAAALGPKRVTGIAMPSRYSSTGSVSDAEALAQTLGIEFHTVPIEQPHHAMEQLLAPLFAGREPDIAEENVQARLRGMILMAYSNKFGSLLVTTGNKSELAVGYCTLYGDMAGGLAVLSDVPKTMVYRLARWMNSESCPLYQELGRPPIPTDSITKPPSAELRPDQQDQDSLPPYEVLDQIIERYVDLEQSVHQIIGETGIDAATVRRWIATIDRNEYKRKQIPPGLKVTGRAFGFGRRMPIAQRFDATGTRLDALRESVSTQSK